MEENITRLAERNLDLFWAVLHIFLLEVHPIKCIFLEHTPTTAGHLPEQCQTSTRRHRSTGKTLDTSGSGHPRECQQHEEHRPENFTQKTSPGAVPIISCNLCTSRRTQDMTRGVFEVTRCVFKVTRGVFKVARDVFKVTKEGVPVHKPPHQSPFSRQTPLTTQQTQAGTHPSPPGTEGTPEILEQLRTACLKWKKMNQLVLRVKSWPTCALLVVWRVKTPCSALGERIKLQNTQQGPLPQRNGHSPPSVGTPDLHTATQCVHQRPDQPWEFHQRYENWYCQHSPPGPHQG